MGSVIGIAFFILSVLAGCAGVTFLLPGFSSRLRLAAGSVAGIVGAAWVSFVLSLILPLSWAVGITFLLCAGCVAWGRNLIALPRGPRSWKEWLLATAVAVPAAYLFFTHALLPVAGGWHVPGYSWGDTPIHMTMMSAVAYQDHFSMRFPIFYQAPLSYPFLFDFYSGILLRLGCSWQLSLLIPGLSVFLAACYVSCACIATVLKSRVAAGLQLGLFLLAGSAWGTVEFARRFAQEGWVAAWLADYTNLGDQGLNFANPLTSHFLPQRSFLSGFAVVMVIFVVLFRSEGRKGIWLAAFLLGALPFVHVHSFFVALATWIVLAAWDRLVGDRTVRSSFLPILFSLVIATPQLLWQFSSTYHAEFGYWYAGWMRAWDESFLTFWVRNAGFALAFLIAAPWVALKAKSRELAAVLIVAAGVLVATNVRIFQPNPFDNMKFMLYAYWALMAVAAWVLSRARGWKLALALPIAATMVFPGLLAVAREMHFNPNYLLFSNADLRAAEAIRGLVPKDAKALTSSAHNNVIVSIAGRPVLVGYTGWLWSYGIDPQEEEAARLSILRDEPGAAELIQKYGLTHLALTDREAFQFRADIPALTSRYPLLYRDEGWRVFLLSSPR